MVINPMEGIYNNSRNQPLRVALKKGVQDMSTQRQPDHGRPTDTEVVKQSDDVIAQDIEAVITR